ncbi:troponin T, skeletal muscle-like [Macrobrachium nipponense]|uniref:troponin T, skeletal muscle-like n=1 Tax=Macrobrachium nipponense TaxID=159736 RepID=UPI0030C86F34
MASSWESFIAASTSAAPAHTSVATTPTAVASAAGGPTVPPTMPVTAPVSQMTYTSEGGSHHTTPTQYHQPHTASQLPHHGMRVNIPPQAGSSSAGPTTTSPQTPVAGPPPQVGAQVHETDLPQDMLAAGWRKFWSKREQRIYFWNRITGESLWDMPPGQVAHGAHPPGKTKVRDREEEDEEERKEEGEEGNQEEYEEEEEQEEEEGEDEEEVEKEEKNENKKIRGKTRGEEKEDEKRLR